MKAKYLEIVQDGDGVKFATFGWDKGRVDGMYTEEAIVWYLENAPDVYDGLNDALKDLQMLRKGTP